MSLLSIGYVVLPVTCQIQTALAAPSLVFFPRARTCSPHHKRRLCFRSRARARKKILRDHHGPWVESTAGAVVGRHNPIYTHSVSSRRSANRTCGFPASGSLQDHAFAHGRSPVFANRFTSSSRKTKNSSGMRRVPCPPILCYRRNHQRSRGQGVPSSRPFVEPHRTRLLPSLSHAVPYGVSRPFPVLPDSFVNHLALAPASTTPRPGVLSSSGITRSQRYYDPIRHPKGPVPRLTAPPLASAARQPPSGVSRVAHDPSFAHAVATTPAEPLGAHVVRLPQRRRPSPYLRRVGFRIALFEACSAFTARYGLCAR